MLVCIAALSGGIRTSGRNAGKAYDCIDQNCGVVGLIGAFNSSPGEDIISPYIDPQFFATFILSVVSASFGMCRFLKSGPMTLVPRQSLKMTKFSIHKHIRRVNLHPLF